MAGMQGFLYDFFSIPSLFLPFPLFLQKISGSLTTSKKRKIKYRNFCICADWYNFANDLPA